MRLSVTSPTTNEPPRGPTTWENLEKLARRDPGRIETTKHSSFVTNGPTESMNNLIKRIKRIAFGMTNFANFRIRALLSAGKPDWSLLDTVTPVTTHISSALGS